MTLLARLDDGTQIETASKQVRCQNCKRLLGWLTPGLFRRTHSYDEVEAPATVHLKCLGCGYVNDLRLCLPERG